MVRKGYLGSDRGESANNGEREEKRNAASMMEREKD